MNTKRLTVLEAIQLAELREFVSRCFDNAYLTDILDEKLRKIIDPAQENPAWWKDIERRSIDNPTPVHFPIYDCVHKNMKIVIPLNEKEVAEDRFFHEEYLPDETAEFLSQSMTRGWEGFTAAPNTWQITAVFAQMDGKRVERSARFVSFDGNFLKLEIHAVGKGTNY